MSGNAFDYVIVGAGSAGCVLANRLSEDPAVSVALIEAGGRDRNPWIHIPAGYYRNFSNPAITWQFGSGPEPHLDGRTVPWPRGRVLGGSSAINGLLYVRGQAQDFDVWRQLGNVGWSYEDVLPYFKRAEDQERGADEYHGAGGPARRVRRAPAAEPDVRGLHRRLRRRPASRATPTSTAPSQEGAGYFQLTNRNGRRCSTAVAYLRPARSRPNLRVITGALVHGLELDGRRATGVRCARDGQVETITARARGDPGRRRHRLAADPAAVGHRPGRGAARRPACRCATSCPASARTCRTTCRCASSTHCSGRGSLNDVWHSRWQQLLHRPRVRAHAARHPHHRRRRGRRVRALAARRRACPTSSSTSCRFSADRPGQGLHTFSGVTATRVPAAPREPRHARASPAPTRRRSPSIVSNYLAAEADRRVLLDGMKLVAPRRRASRRSPASWCASTCRGRKRRATRR